MKKTLLVGSNFSALPLLNRLQARGHHVAVCGNRPDDACHKLADQSFFMDYADRDALIDMVQAQGFDFLVPTGNDCSYRVAARVAAQMGFPGFDPEAISETLHTKAAFRRSCRDVGLSVPNFVVLGPKDGMATVDALIFPVMVKPVDSFSGRGIVRLGDRAGLEQAVAQARKHSAVVVVEEFFEGTLHSHSAFLKDRRVFFDVFVDEFCTVYPWQVNCSNHPSILGAALCTALRQEVEKLAGALNLVDGLFHTQFLAAPSGDFRIVESMRRCPGDLYGSLIERSTGVDYCDLFIRPFVRDSYPNEPIVPQAVPWARHSLSGGQLYFSSQHDLSLISQELVPLALTGADVPAAPYGRVAVFFARFADTAQLWQITPKLAEHVCVRALKDIK